MKYSFDNLVIEVTRRCNMHCEHCLRGDAQNLDINTDYIEALMSKTNYIGSITFSGGEPSLNIKAIEFTRKCCQKYNVSVGAFFVATNGKKDPINLIVEMLRWYSYCDEKECCNITISSDCFHEHINPDHIDLLNGLSFSSDIKTVDWDTTCLIDEGRAVNLKGFQKRSVAYYDEGVEIEDDGDNNLRLCSIVYLSANGDIRTNCNSAFDDYYFTIGNLNDSNFDNIISSYIPKDIFVY